VTRNFGSSWPRCKSAREAGNGDVSGAVGAPQGGDPLVGEHAVCRRSATQRYPKRVRGVLGGSGEPAGPDDIRENGTFFQ
jgi:hypothetical protein